MSPTTSNERLGGAIRGQHDDAPGTWAAPGELAKRNGIRPHGHPLNCQVSSHQQGAGGGRPQVDRKGEVDRSVRDHEHGRGGARPAKLTGQREIRQRKAGNHKTRGRERSGAGQNE